ncbi:MAG: hypothetical protein V2I27_15550 [Erythrobacter sp.]|jgi:hypothetical protein|nr:hypothetical protein [Erythrobacter sp.]
MPGTRTLKTAAGAILIAAIPTAPVLGQAASGSDAIETSPIVAKLETCTTLTDDAERLACFDREVGALVGATSTGEVKVVDAEAIKEARRGLFGFRLPKIGLFGEGDEEEIEILQSTVTRVRQVAPNEWHFWIAEGDAQWRIKNGRMGFRPPEVNDEVEFKPASMGTYWIKINGRTGVRGERIG